MTKAERSSRSRLVILISITLTITKTCTHRILRVLIKNGTTLQPIQVSSQIQTLLSMVEDKATTTKETKQGLEEAIKEAATITSLKLVVQACRWATTLMLKLEDQATLTKEEEATIYQGMPELQTNTLELVIPTLSCRLLCPIQMHDLEGEKLW